MQQQGKQALPLPDGQGAVLVVSFGTSYPQTLEATIGAIEREMAGAFPRWEVRRAFTSGVIIRKILQRDGVAIDTVAQALQRLAEEGVRRVVCQPTHVMGGFEYDGMLEQIRPFAGRFEQLGVGAPLLASNEDYEQVARAVVDTIGVPPEEALILMGHGTDHLANATYPAMDYRFKEMGYPNVFVGTVEGYPELSHVHRALQQGGYRRVTLAPLMVVAGEHAQNDLAGEQPDSWKNRLLQAGYQVRCQLMGLGEYPQIRALYVAHARRAMG